MFSILNALKSKLNATYNDVVERVARNENVDEADIERVLIGKTLTDFETDVEREKKRIEADKLGEQVCELTEQLDNARAESGYAQRELDQYDREYYSHRKALDRTATETKQKVKAIQYKINHLEKQRGKLCDYGAN